MNFPPNLYRFQRHCWSGSSGSGSRVPSGIYGAQRDSKFKTLRGKSQFFFYFKRLRAYRARYVVLRIISRVLNSLPLGVDFDPLKNRRTECRYWSVDHSATQNTTTNGCLFDCASIADPFRRWLTQIVGHVFPSAAVRRRSCDSSGPGTYRFARCWELQSADKQGDRTPTIVAT